MRGQAGGSDPADEAWLRVPCATPCLAQPAPTRLRCGRNSVSAQTPRLLFVTAPRFFRDSSWPTRVDTRSQTSRRGRASRPAFTCQAMRSKVEAMERLDRSLWPLSGDRARRISPGLVVAVSPRRATAGRVSHPFGILGIKRAEPAVPGSRTAARSRRPNDTSASSDDAMIPRPRAPGP